jgi:thiol-disulfide isomerase/thioredoxin
MLLAGCASRPPAAGQVALRDIDAPGLARTLAEHRGQVVLVDFWATWCGPCVALLPHAVELHERFGDRGLAVVTVSLDDPGSRSAVQNFLARRGATTENRLSTYGIGSAAFEAFNIPDGAIPCVRLYDRQGKLRRTFAVGGKPIDPEQMERAVEEMMNR